VQEQAISLVQNLVYGDPDSVEQIFADESLLLQAVEKQLVTSRPEISLQVGLHIVQSISLNLCISLLTIIQSIQARTDCNSVICFGVCLDLKKAVFSPYYE
jgi:hypothetical protein